MNKDSSYNRRQFMFGSVLALTTASIAACTRAAPARTSPVIHTVDSLLADSPFYVAHRGSGDNWTEHSMRAYSQSVLHGASAIEVSVQASKDGILVCHHDATLQRLAGDKRKISELTYMELQKTRLDARPWIGPAEPLQPIPLVREVLDKFSSSHVIFLEDKQGTNTEALLKLMDSYQDSTAHLVWKQGARGAHSATVKKHGYKIWTYFDEGQVDMFDEIVSSSDMVGMFVDADDEVFRALVAFGKPVISWEVHTRSARDRLQSLGVQGIMCSNILYVQSSTSLYTTDTFGSGLRAAGDLPWTTNKGWGTQPDFHPERASISMKMEVGASYIMGSLCPITADSYRINVQMRWTDTLPKQSGNIGIAFGQESDADYRVYIPSEVSGYHLIFRPDGEIVVFSRSAGQVEGTRIGSIHTQPVQAGEWVELKVMINPHEIHVSRMGQQHWKIAIANDAFRGGYISLCKNYVEPVSAEFRKLSIT